MVKIRGKERTEVRRLLNDYRLISAKSISEKVEEATGEIFKNNLRNKMADSHYIQCPNCSAFDVPYDYNLKASEVVCPTCGFVIKNPVDQWNKRTGL